MADFFGAFAKSEQNPFPGICGGAKTKIERLAVGSLEWFAAIGILQPSVPVTRTLGCRPLAPELSLPGMRLRYQTDAPDRADGHQNSGIFCGGIFCQSIILRSGLINASSCRPAWIWRKGVPQ
jgi:hypothetical protein